jgi:hypothetical protein
VVNRIEFKLKVNRIRLNLNWDYFNLYKSNLNLNLVGVRFGRNES